MCQFDEVVSVAHRSIRAFSLGMVSKQDISRQHQVKSSMRRVDICFWNAILSGGCRDMNAKTQKLYARLAAVRHAQTSQALHSAQAAIALTHENIERNKDQAQKNTEEINQTLQHGAHAALAALSYHQHLHSERNHQQLSQQLQNQNQQLEQAKQAQQQSRRKQKSAEKMGEQLMIEQRMARSRREQINQDDLAGVFPSLFPSLYND